MRWLADCRVQKLSYVVGTGHLPDYCAVLHVPKMLTRFQRILVVRHDERRAVLEIYPHKVVNGNTAINGGYGMDNRRVVRHGSAIVRRGLIDQQQTACSPVEEKSSER
ncbi:spore coat protein, putative [Babesia ovata]|uniref:Spore coat protein, putative n=1 Tax=Babesia ovata TaxID=189622 RepID=A0A2H6K7X5_9APIC|nr:spore coat protein, putative [Babesia ovata]GBE59059.1 spore coat protein, putative [Babesia ovata]